VGLKAEHYSSILADAPDVGFFEVHAENFMGAGGPPHRYLEAIRSRYPLSIHGVGLSLGSDRPLDRTHLQRLQHLLARYEPGLFSEHLAWSTHGSGYLSDLLPLPYTQATLDQVCFHIDQTQEALQRRLLLENPSTYVTFTRSTFTETEFLASVATRTGCQLLLDVNNIHVSAVNHGCDAQAWLDSFPFQHVAEIHLAGFAENRDTAGGRLLIDDHGSVVHADVWDLYSRALMRTGPVPTLIEWDNDVPVWERLYAESAKAQEILSSLPRQSAAEVRHAAMG
jgi:uncharacterized protein (UPF0276 family)